MPMPSYFTSAAVVPASVRKLENDAIVADVTFATGETLPVEFRPITKNTFERKLLIKVDGMDFDVLDPDSDVMDYYFGLSDVAWKVERNKSDAHRNAVRAAVLGSKEAA